MIKKLALMSMLCTTLACADEKETSASDPQGDGADGSVGGEAQDACAVLEGPATELFGVDTSQATVRSNQLSGNDLCRILWEIPEIDQAERNKRAVDRDLRDNNEVSLTIMGTSYDSAAAAVTSLEESVKQLTEGVTVEGGGGEQTVQTEFGDWLEGVGDRAIRKGGSVLVAVNGRRFTAAVSVSDDKNENQTLAIELAKKIVAAM